MTALIDEIEIRNNKALEALFDACENNKFTLKASIPARLDVDQDILIGRSLGDCRNMIEVVKNAIAFCKEPNTIDAVNDELIALVKSVKDFEDIDD